MSDLIEKIRINQVRIAEAIVLDSLVNMGLADPVAPAVAPSVDIPAADLAQWFLNALQYRVAGELAADIERIFVHVPVPDVARMFEPVAEQLRRKLATYDRGEAATTLNDIADLFGIGSAVRDPQNIVFNVRNSNASLNILRARMREAALEFPLNQSGEPDVEHLAENIRASKNLAGKGDLKPIHDQLENCARSIARHYPREWDRADIETGGVLVGVRGEDAPYELDGFVSIDISNYSGEEQDDIALADYLIAARPENVVGLYDRIRSLEAQLKEYEVAYAMALGAELERVAPGGKLL